MKSRTFQTWLAVMVVGIGLLATAIGGLHVYMTTTATPLHQTMEGVPSAMKGPPSEAWMTAVEQSRHVVRTAMLEQNLPGLSVAVGVAGNLVWAEGFGWADLDAQVTVTPDSRFRLGTASMVLTSAGVGQLVEQGRLSLDENIRTYVPEFPEKQWPVTLRQVLSHTAGLITDGGDEGPFDEHCARAVDGVRLLADAPLRYEPGTRYRFSNFSGILASAAIERAVDESFVTYMRRHVFEPLGMDGTRPDAADNPISDRVTSYFPRYAARPKYGLHLTRRLDLSCYAGAKVFLSTAPDMVRFGLAINGGMLLRPETVTQLQTSQRLTSGEETGYGLGWDVEMMDLSGAQVRWVGHEGDVLGGPVTALVTLPDHGIVVSVMSNVSYAGVEPLAVEIAKAFRVGFPGNPTRKE